MTEDKISPHVSKAPKLFTINLVLFAIAAAIASYMVWHHYTLVNGDAGFGSFCSLGEKVDCDAVNASEYSEVFGIPLATFALSYYLIAIILSMVARVNAYARREATLFLSALSTISVLASIGTIGVMTGILHNYCVMCLSLSLLDFATFAVTMLALQDLKFGSSFGREIHIASKKRMGAYLGTAFGLFVVIAGLSSQLRVDHFPLADAERFINDYRAQPVRQIEVGDSPVQGLQGSNPPVRIIEFADFQCPACGMAAKQMHRLVKVNGSKMQLIFKNFPLDPSCNPLIHNPMHEYACLAAKAAYCAQKQGKWLEMYEKLYGNQREISRENIKAWATEMGINIAQLEECIPSDEADKAVKADITAADKAGIESTPTFFVNGRMVKGVIDENRLKLLFRELGL